MKATENGYKIDLQNMMETRSQTQQKADIALKNIQTEKAHFAKRPVRSVRPPLPGGFTYGR